MKCTSLTITGLAALIGLVAVFLLYGSLVKDPGGIFLSSTGDGLKNYYTFAYHIEHDENALHFAGMNYPYGEHIVYTDAQPAFSIPLQFLARLFPQLAHHSVGLLNLLMLLDFVLCVVLFTHVLRAYGLPNLMAVLAALGIALLSPQVLRMYGHFGLVYSSFLPMVWLLALKLLGGQRRWLYSLLLCICIFILFMVHPYLGLIGAGFSALYGLFNMAYEWLTKRKFSFRGLLLLFPGILAIGIFRFLTNFGAAHGPRDPIPGGIHKYVSSWMSVLHPFPNVPGLITDQILPGEPGNWEGIAYWGLGTMLALVLIALFVFRRNARNAIFINTENSLLIPILSAMSLLLFSFGWHLDIPWITESPLAQFRTLGRFAWPSYYVLAVTANVLVYRLFSAIIKNRAVRVAATLTIPLLFCYEGTMVRNWAHGIRTYSENAWTTEALQQKWGPLAQDYDLSSFKACIPIPYFHIGSKRVLIEGSDELKSAAFSLSIYSGIPLMASDMARTSYTEARTLVQAMGCYSYLSEASSFFAKGDSLLVIHKGQITKSSDLHLLKKCDKLGEYGNYDFYFLPVERLFSNEAIQEFEDFRALYPDTALWDGRLLYDSTDQVFYEDFEAQTDQAAINGKGSWKAPLLEQNTLLKIDEGSLDPERKYIASFWSRRGLELEMSGSIFIERKDKKNGTHGWEPSGENRTPSAIRGPFVLTELVFSPRTSTESFRFFFMGKGSGKGYMLLDDAMIRPMDSDVYRLLQSETGSQLMHNGCFYDLPMGTLSNPAIISPPDLQ